MRKFGDREINSLSLWDRAARQFEAAIQNGGSAVAYGGAARAYLGQNRLLEAPDHEYTQRLVAAAPTLRA